MYLKKRRWSRKEKGNVLQCKCCHLERERERQKNILTNVIFQNIIQTKMKNLREHENFPWDHPIEEIGIILKEPLRMHLT